MAIFTNEVEQQVLGGLLNTQNYWADYSEVLTDDCFAHEINQTIFSVITRTYNLAQTLDKTLLINKLKNSGISYADKGIEISDYCDIIARNKPNSVDFKSYVADVIKWSTARFLFEGFENIKKTVMKNPHLNVQEILNLSEKNSAKFLGKILNEGDVIDLFDGIMEQFEEIGNNPVDEIGLDTPYERFNGLYGGFKPGNVYTFCSRPKNGKTTFLNNTAFKMANQRGQRVPTLILDTEMGESEAMGVKSRLMASLTGINPWYFETGNWRKNPEMVKIMRNPELIKAVKEYKLHYKYLPDASTEKLKTVIKRWNLQHVGRGNQCLVSYDYLKMTGGDSTGNKGAFEKEHQIIGEKINALKELFGKEINAPLLTAVQLNRSGDQNGNQQRDDTTAIASSDKITWFSSYVGIFRKKSVEEIAEQGQHNGTHALITLATRYQGKDGAGAHDIVKTHEGKFVRNFMNFTVDNFDVKESSSAQEMYDELAKNLPPQKKQFKKQDSKESF